MTIRAFVALVGFAIAGVALYLIPDVSRFTDHPSWGVPVLWAVAGLIAAIGYQSGSLRWAGMRMNVPLLVLVFLPWTIVGIAIIAHMTGQPAWLAQRARDVFTSGFLSRMADSVGAISFASGLLLGLGIVEPRLQASVARQPVTTADPLPASAACDRVA